MQSIEDQPLWGCRGVAGVDKTAYTYNPSFAATPLGGYYAAFFNKICGMQT
jgi:hypothetical protein